MNKMAIFVEGYTEMLFVERLITELAAKNQVKIEKRKIRGGGAKSGVKQYVTLIETSTPSTGHQHFVLIYDCGNDELVKTRMVKEYDNLTGQGAYQTIVCVRDVYPIPANQISQLERGLKSYVKTKPVKVDFILSVMELEAWLIAEHTHFPKVDPAITCDAIAATHGFDPRVDDISSRPSPSTDLNACYGIAGKTYQKGSSDIISKVDFTNVYFEVSTRFDHLKRLCSIIEGFLAV